MGKQASSTVLKAVTKDDGQDYQDLMSDVQRLMAVRQAVPLFTTNVTGLWDMYLNGIPEAHRQNYNCNACRRFIERFGGLVTIDESGHLDPAIWPVEVGDLFANSVAKIRRAITTAKVTGVFFSSKTTFGTPVTEGYHHLSAQLKSPRFQNRLLTDDQAMAEKVQDFVMLTSSIGEYHQDMVQKALLLLKADALYRAEKVLGVATWLNSLHDSLSGIKDRSRRNNIVWKFVATAPAGFCHVRASMIGSLLDDLVNGLSQDEVVRRFKDKMDPLKYQRPQASPSSGNIARAEEIVAKLNLTDSLRRRFARRDEVKLIWQPSKPAEVSSAGVFGHLKPKQAKPSSTEVLPKSTMTWDKFQRTLLAEATDIEVEVTNVNMNFSAVLTQAVDDAVPILQWDRDEQRNPFSSYVYSGGSHARNWNLTPGWALVTGIMPDPAHWYQESPNHAKRAFLLIDGCVDQRDSGLALFPEILHSSLREVRSTIEAFSRSGKLEGRETASACGLQLLSQPDRLDINLRVTTELGQQLVTIDRWD